MRIRLPLETNKPLVFHWAECCDNAAMVCEWHKNMLGSMTASGVVWPALNRWRPSFRKGPVGGMVTGRSPPTDMGLPPIYPARPSSVLSTLTTDQAQGTKSLLRAESRQTQQLAHEIANCRDCRPLPIHAGGQGAVFPVSQFRRLGSTRGQVREGLAPIDGALRLLQSCKSAWSSINRHG